MKNLLRTPQGTEGISFSEAYYHRRIVHTLEELFIGWGYYPVEVPVFDFYDNYAPLLGPARDQVYRLIDREGDLLLLRSDMTLFLAKQMATILEPADLPVRVSYADTILRHQDREDISKNEFFQTGCELIGLPGKSGEIEILLIALSIFQSLGITESIFHLGSRKLFDSLTQNMKAAEQEEIFNVLQTREFDRLPPHREDLKEMLRFIGSPKEAEQLAQRWETKGAPEVSAHVRELCTICTEVSPLFPDNEIRIDLSQIGTQPYHTGIAFQGYMQGAGSAVISGGRYDRLLGHFGFAAPSVGFSLMLRKVEALVPDLTLQFPQPETCSVTNSNLRERFLKAKELRQKGKQVLFTLPEEQNHDG